MKMDDLDRALLRARARADGRVIRYAIGVRDSGADFRMLSEDDWKRTVAGDSYVSLTRDFREAKLWRTEDAVWLAYHEYGMGQRGYQCFPVGIEKAAVRKAAQWKAAQ